MSAKQDALKQAGLEKLIKGEVQARRQQQGRQGREGPVRRAGHSRARTDLTLLGEFGDQPANAHPGHPAHNGAAGPSHNEIPQPESARSTTRRSGPPTSARRITTTCCTTRTRPSMAQLVSRAVVRPVQRRRLRQRLGPGPVQRGGLRQQLLRQQSSARATSAGSSRTRPTRGGHAARRSAGSAGRRSTRSWRTFDVWDRYDYDGDGNFDEPDGYIDHFQSVHAGEGEETGGGAQGTDAIWSHRSYVNSVPIGTDGPGGFAPFGGARIGDSNYWIGDYTVEPENGGVGVFAHEFAHDLGLPDLYDTSGNTGGAENSTAWWTVMSQGSYGTVNGDGHRLAPDALRRLGEAPARLARTTTVAPGEQRTDQARPGRDQHQQPQAIVRRPAGQGQVDHRRRRPVRRRQLLLLRHRQRPRQHDDAVGHAAGRDRSARRSRPGTTSSRAGTTRTCRSRPTAARRSRTSTRPHRPTDNTNGQNFGEGITGISGTPLACDDDLTPTPSGSMSRPT